MENYTDYKFTSKCDCKLSFAQAILKAAIHGEKILSDWGFNEEEIIDYSSHFIEGQVPSERSEGEFYIQKNEEGFAVDYWDLGTSKAVIENVMKESAKSFLALFPGSEIISSYYNEYGGENWGAIAAQKGRIIFHDAFELCEVREEDMEEWGIIEDEDDEDLEEENCEKSQQYFRSYELIKYFDEYEPIVVYPDFYVNWTGNGTYNVIKASIECGQVEDVQSAVERRIISKEQLQDALDYSSEVQDPEVSAIIREWTSKY